MIIPALLADGIVRASTRMFADEMQRKRIVDRLVAALNSYLPDELSEINHATGAPGADGKRVDAEQARATCAAFIDAVSQDLDADDRGTGSRNAEVASSTSATSAPAETWADLDSSSAGSEPTCADLLADLEVTWPADPETGPGDLRAQRASSTRRVQPIESVNSAPEARSAEGAEGIESICCAPRGTNESISSATSAGNVLVQKLPKCVADFGDECVSAEVAEVASPDFGSECVSAEVAEVDVPLRHLTDSMPPQRDALVYAEIQLWHNTDAGDAKKSEWAMKLRCAHADNPVGALSEHHVFFCLDPRRFREKLRRFAEAGKLSSGWVEEICAGTQSMHSNVWMGLISRRATKSTQRRPEGQSSNQRDIADGYMATLQLNTEGSAPKRLRIYLGDAQPIVVDTFNDPGERTKYGAPRKTNASDYVAYYDPHGTFAQMRREQRTQNAAIRAENLGHAAPNPITPLMQIALDAMAPHLVEQRDRIDALERRVAGLEALLRDS